MELFNLFSIIQPAVSNDNDTSLFFNSKFGSYFLFFRVAVPEESVSFEVGYI